MTNVKIKNIRDTSTDRIKAICQEKVKLIFKRSIKTAITHDKETGTVNI